MAAVFNYRYMFDFTMVMFASPIEDMSHGWLVPFVSLAVLWQQRDATGGSGGAESGGRGMVMVFWCLVRRAWRAVAHGAVSFIGLVWALPYAWGRGVERLMRFRQRFCASRPSVVFPRFFHDPSTYLFDVARDGLLNGVGLAVGGGYGALFAGAGAEFNVDVADRVAVSARCSR